MTIIPLGPVLPRGSSHLPADSVGHVDVCLFGVAPRRDCRVSLRTEPARLCGSDPHLTVDGSYPLRCPMESRLSSARPEGDTAIAWLASPRYFTRLIGLEESSLRRASSFVSTKVLGFAIKHL